LYAYPAFNELTAFLVFGQLVIDYHIEVASIARSLTSYVVTILEMFPVLKDNIPNWIGHGGEVFFGGTLSINLPSRLMFQTGHHCSVLCICWV
jgi:APA family basic amino acid/polyamine antiporter